MTAVRTLARPHVMPTTIAGMAETRMQGERETRHPGATTIGLAAAHRVPETTTATENEIGLEMTDEVAIGRIATAVIETIGILEIVITTVTEIASERSETVSAILTAVSLETQVVTTTATVSETDPTAMAAEIATASTEGGLDPGRETTGDTASHVHAIEITDTRGAQLIKQPPCRITQGMLASELVSSE